MYNFRELNEKADLKTLYETITGMTLRKHSDSWEGPCPMCGGKDRFYIKYDRTPQQWTCRHCQNNRMHTALDFVRCVYGIDIKDSAERLAQMLGVSETETLKQVKQVKQIEMKPTKPEPPTQEWQELVKPIVDRAQSFLWSNGGMFALEYLLNVRKLTQKTIRTYKLGYNPNDFVMEISTGDVYFHAGIFFPNYIDKDLYRVKIRLDNPDTVKYKFVSNGGKAVSLYGANFTQISDHVIYCEGEMDAMTINQCAGDICKAVTFGSNAYIGGAEQWQQYYRIPEHTVICFDNDSDENTRNAVRRNELKLQTEIIKAQSLDIVQNRAHAPRICHLPEQFHDWNDILQQENGTKIIRDILTGFFNE